MTMGWSLTTSSFLQNQHENYTMIPVIVYGPPASGKTRNAEALRKYFGLTNIFEEWCPGTAVYKDTLYLTTFDVPSLYITLPACTIMHISEALALLEASNASF